MDINTTLGDAVMVILKTLSAEIANASLSANEKTSTLASSESPVVYKPDELAKKLGLSPALVYTKLLANPPFPVRRVGRRILVPAKTFDSWLKGDEGKDWRRKNHA